MKVRGIKMSVVLCSCLILRLSGCFLKKSDPKPLTELEKLPAITGVGKGTFGCLINGKAYVANNQYDASATFQKAILSIAGNTKNPIQGIGLTIVERNGIGVTTTTYPLNDYPNSFSLVNIQP